MIYLILLYWIFAALFCYGVVSEVAKKERKSIHVVFMGCLLIGGILLPIYLGRSLILDKNLQKMIKQNKK